MRDFQRRKATRPTHDRILIVCEGTKTEPKYLTDLVRSLKLSTTYIKVTPSLSGSSPKKVLEHALKLFQGTTKDPNNRKLIKNFDEIALVFDRDDHTEYFETLAQIEELNNGKKKLKNSDGKTVSIVPYVSIPCFELWVLLHHENYTGTPDREAVFRRLGIVMPEYKKGNDGLYGRITEKTDVALKSAERINEGKTPWVEDALYVGIGELVSRLLGFGTRGKE